MFGPALSNLHHRVIIALSEVDLKKQTEANITDHNYFSFLSLLLQLGFSEEKENCMIFRL